MLARYKWVERATAKIRFRPDREAVARELTEHIQDLLDHYGETGMGEEAAEAAGMVQPSDGQVYYITLPGEDQARAHRPEGRGLEKFFTALGRGIPGSGE